MDDSTLKEQLLTMLDDQEVQGKISQIISKSIDKIEISEKVISSQIGQATKTSIDRIIKFLHQENFYPQQSPVVKHPQ